MSSKPSLDLQGQEYEEQHVQQVYEQIASHFSSTRYKPWPIIERFLKELPDGSVGLDVGCGNGKYLAVNPNVLIMGSDRSLALTKIAARYHPHAAIVADNLALPHPNSYFDFALSIAVVHHLSTPERRIKAIQSILETLKPSLCIEKSQLVTDHRSPRANGGRALIYVWALEQKSSRRGWDDGHDQDIMVPWVMKEKASNDRKFHRYYHLYRSGELEMNIAEAGGRVLDSGYEKDNWWAIAARDQKLD
ncbi:MAG: tRNA methyltransferase, has a role in tRNA modification [Candelina mexicana]|nr:MAG: tRNA methyltransferase, has a role in tRNA modification [Candelina mexicana]